MMMEKCVVCHGTVDTDKPHAKLYLRGETSGDNTYYFDHVVCMYRMMVDYGKEQGWESNAI